MSNQKKREKKVSKYIKEEVENNWEDVEKREGLEVVRGCSTDKGNNNNDGFHSTFHG